MPVFEKIQVELSQPTEGVLHLRHGGGRYFSIESRSRLTEPVDCAKCQQIGERPQAWFRGHGRAQVMISGPIVDCALGYAGKSCRPVRGIGATDIHAVSLRSIYAFRQSSSGRRAVTTSSKPFFGLIRWRPPRRARTAGKSWR